MALLITTNIAAKNNGSYYLLEDTYLKGGFQVRATTDLRDAIPEGNKKVGMLVYTQDFQKIWQLTRFTPSNPSAVPPTVEIQEWSELKTGGGEAVKNERKVALYTTPPMEGGAVHDFSLQLGKSCLLIKLTVSSACAVEAYSNAARFEANPYKFIASSTHLTDDGSTTMADGSVVKGRRYTILSNLEEPATDNIYFRISNQSSEKVAISCTLIYLTIE